MIHAFGPGVFPRPALDPDGRRGYLVFREGDPKAPGYVVVVGWTDVAADHFVGLHELARYAVGGASPAFPDVTVSDGMVWVAYHDGTVGHLRCVTTGVHESMAPCENNAPIVFGAGCVAWQGAADHGWPISLMDLSSGEVRPAGRGQGTGLAYVTADRRVVTVDDNRMSVPGLVNPDRAGALLVVGEDPDPNNRDNLSAPWRVGAASGRLWATSPCITPRAAAAGGRFAVAAWGQGADVRLFCGSLDDLIAASVLPIPPIQPPDPEPKPVPEIPSELIDQLAFVGEVRDRLFPDRIGKPLHDAEKAAQWAIHLAWALKRKYPHLPIGLARAKRGSENHGGATPDVPEGFTTDVIAISNGAHWDFQIDGHTGAATPRWALEENPDNYPAIAARFLPAFNPGGGDGGDPGDEDPKRHVYDGGENDNPPGASCDVCGKPKSDSIHKAAEEPTDPPDNPPPAGTVTNAELKALLLKLSTHLGVK